MTDQLEFDLTLFPDPVLRRAAQPVEHFDAGLGATIAAMWRRVYASNGVGLAAPQVGLKQRLLIISPEGKSDPKTELVLVNPCILELCGPKTLFEEGCLSFPGIYAEIERPELCRVSALDASGKAFEASYEGFTSRIVQHEYDHLEGVLLVDRMSPTDKLRHKVALEELVARYKKARAKQASRAR